MAIQLTETARKRMQDYLAKSGAPGVRFGVKRTGCSGYGYVVDVADAQTASDVVFDIEGVRVLVMNEPTRVLAAAGSFDPSAINKRTPMGRMGSEEEAAQGIAYLLSPEAASYVTGHTLEVNGGWTAYGYL